MKPSRGTGMTSKKQKGASGGLPAKAEILAFIREHGGKAGKREIARAFAISGSDRIALKRLLAELADDGEISRRRRKLVRPGALPPVAVILITGRDGDGDLVGAPPDWITEDDGPAPLVQFAPASKRGSGPAAGVNDRVLARLTALGETAKDGRPLYSATVIKRLDRLGSARQGDGPGVCRAATGLMVAAHAARPAAVDCMATKPGSLTLHWRQSMANPVRVFRYAMLN